MIAKISNIISIMSAVVAVTSVFVLMQTDVGELKKKVIILKGNVIELECRVIWLEGNHDISSPRYNIARHSDCTK